MIDRISDTMRIVKANDALNRARHDFELIAKHSTEPLVQAHANSSVERIRLALEKTER